MTPREPPRGASAFGDPDLRDQLARLRRQQETLFAQLQSGEQHFRQLARSVWRVQEDERRRLARDLHDGIGQHLTALRHRLDALARDARFAEATALSEARELCGVAVEEIRALSRLLRPQVLDDLGLEAALRWLARNSGEDGRRVVEVEVAELPDVLDGDLSTLVFRVAQEALANAQKHSAAKTVIVRVSARADRLVLLVVDDGIGCDIDEALEKSRVGDSTGLASVRERVRLFGGEMSLASRPGEGFRMRVVLPLPAAETSA